MTPEDADPIRPPETDDEPWVVSTEHLPWEWESHRLSLRVLILCGAIGAAIAFAAWLNR